MAEQTESFGLELRDGLSASAKSMSTQLGSLQTSMKGVGAEIRALQATQLAFKEKGMTAASQQAALEIAKKKQMLAGMKEQAGAMKDATRQQDQLAKKQKSEGVAAAKAYDAALDELTGGLWEFAKYAGIAAVAVGTLIAAGAALAIEAATFRTRMTNVFSIFRGTAKEGAATYEMVRQMSRTLPIPQEKAFESAQELLSLGLQGQNRLHNTVQSIANMQAVMGDAAGGKLKSIIGNAQTSTMGGRFRGVFSVTPAELKEIGLSYDQLAGVIGKKLGYSNAVAKQMLMYGRIDAATGIDALNQAITKGGIGEAAKDALLAPDLLISQFKSHIQDLFADVDIKPFMREMRNIVNLFDLQNASGKTMKATITGTFNTLLTLGKNVLIGLQVGFLRVELAVLRTAVFLAPMVKEIKRLGENQTFLDAMGYTFAQLANWAGLFAFAIITSVGGMAKMVNMFDSLRKSQPVQVGMDLMQGLSDGMIQGSVLVAKAAENIGTEALKSLRKAFDSHSPSRKGALIGRDLALGVRQGAEAEGLDFGGGGALTFRAAAPRDSGGGKGGLTIEVAAGAIVIQGAGISNAEQFAAMLAPALADVFERATEELGYGRD